MTSRLDLFSQTASALKCPTEPFGSVRLNISAFTNVDVENFAYDYLAIFVENEGDQYDSPAVQGEYTLDGDYLAFSPYFPFERGMTYMVRTKKVDTNHEYSYQPFLLEKNQKVGQAKVLRIYPSGNQLPENLLRFYFYFNTPMKKGQALTHIQLIDAAGYVDTTAFMAFKQELWSPDGKRLTVLFDPGRIKRGVSANMELGPALLEGNRYRLTVSTAWQDVYGQPLSEKTTKEFVVEKAYRHRLKVNDGMIRNPEANSLEPLTIYFDRAMDHALAESMIQVESEEGKLIAGRWKILEQEQLVQFEPEKYWQQGKYKIVIDSRLEDVAGNNLQTLLDQIESDKDENIDPHQLIEFDI